MYTFNFFCYYIKNNLVKFVGILYYAVSIEEIMLKTKILALIYNEY